MPILIHPTRTGSVFLRNFDRGVVDSLGAVEGSVSGFGNMFDPADPCFFLSAPGATGGGVVRVYFENPEAIFTKKLYPFISIVRDDFTPALGRWMEGGQLEFRAGVSGTQVVVNGVSGFCNYESKIQAIPHDITYTISIWDRYEAPVQAILLKALKVFPAIGKLFVSDDLDLDRTYEAYREGSVTSLEQVIDPVTKVKGYAFSIRVEGELDLAEQDISNSAVSGVDLRMYRI